MKIGLNFCISGFTQTEAKPHGVYRLKEKIIAQIYDSGCLANIRVEMRQWNDNWKNVADHVHILNTEREVLVNVYAYSWGAGWGFVQLANQLKKRGITIKTAVLCDPVYRHPNLLLRWKSLLSRDWTTFSPFIKIPSNVETVHHFHQTLDRPQGHMLWAEDVSKTRITEAVKLERTHSYIQFAEEWHQKCLTATSDLALLCT